MTPGEGAPPRYELRLPLAPYRFVWANEPAVDCRVTHADLYDEEHYTHADGSFVRIRNYRADGSFHIVSDRGEIELTDHAADYRSPRAESEVRLP